MICKECKIKETDSTSGLCWWCVNKAIEEQDKTNKFEEMDEQSQTSKKIASDWFDKVNKIPHTYDHSHCWTSDNPPCGQRIKHFQCCICEKLHPDIPNPTALLEAWKRDVKEWLANESDKHEPAYELGDQGYVAGLNRAYEFISDYKLEK